MNFLYQILNLPWSIVGILIALLTGIKKVEVNIQPRAIVFYVKKFWWQNILAIFPDQGSKDMQKMLRAGGGPKAITIGSIILVLAKIPNDFPHNLDKVIDHELIHVEQFNRYPFVFPIVYLIESIKHGYVDNRFEVEAYSRTNTWTNCLLQIRDEKTSNR